MNQAGQLTNAEISAKYAAVLEQDSHNSYEPSEVSNFKNIKTLTLDNDIGKNTTDIIELHNGILVSRTNFCLKQDLIREFTYARPNSSFIILCQGWAEVCSTDNDFSEKLNAGDVLYRNGECHSSYQRFNPKDVATSIINIELNSSMIERWIEESPQPLSTALTNFIKNPQRFISKLPINAMSIRNTAMKLSVIDISNLSGQYEFESGILTILANIFSAENYTPMLKSSNSKKENLSKALKRAKSILDTEWQSPPTISQLARRVGINELYLKNGFKQQNKVTIGKYIHRLKMQYAKSMIANLCCSVEHAALEVGYANSSHFSTAFKKEFGISPSKFK